MSDLKDEIREKFRLGKTGCFTCGGHWTVSVFHSSIVYSYYCCDGYDDEPCPSNESWSYNSFEEFDEDGYDSLDDYGIWEWLEEQNDV